MRRLARVVLWTLAAVLFLLVATNRWGDTSLYPDRSDRAVDIYVVSHGYHSGLAIRRDALARASSRGGGGQRAGVLGTIVHRFAAYPWVEVGWGEARVYRQVPAVEDLTVSLVLSALFRPGNGSVLHVVGLTGTPPEMFPNADIERVALSQEGFENLVVRLAETFSLKEDGFPSELGPGLYGPSLFFRANGQFHIFNVCNHWTARLLSAAGVPTSPVLATLPAGLLFDLRHRPTIRIGGLDGPG